MIVLRTQVQRFKDNVVVLQCGWILESLDQGLL